MLWCCGVVVLWCCGVSFFFLLLWLYAFFVSGFVAVVGSLCVCRFCCVLASVCLSLAVLN